MSHEGRLESLRTRHAALDAQIAAEDSRPRPDEGLLSKLKVEKLHVKQELEKIREGKQPA